MSRRFEAELRCRPGTGCAPSRVAGCRNLASALGGRMRTRADPCRLCAPVLSHACRSMMMESSMARRIYVATVWMVVIAGISLGLGAYVNGQTMTEHSSEARFQLDLAVPDAGVKPFLPPGWSLNVATQGAAKDCNLRAVFIDRVTINAPDGKPMGSNRLVYLAVPVKDAGGANAQLMIGGL